MIAFTSHEPVGKTTLQCECQTCHGTFTIERGVDAKGRIIGGDKKCQLPKYCAKCRPKQKPSGRVCKQCNHSFVGSKGTRFCSPQCKAIFSENKKIQRKLLRADLWSQCEQTCVRCATTFTFGKKSQMCPSCREHRVRKQVEKTCIDCSRMFVGVSTATRCVECRSEHKRKQWKERQRKLSERHGPSRFLHKAQLNGAMSEQLCDLYALSIGWIPFRPTIDGCPNIDRVYVKQNGECVRVQVKTAGRVRYSNDSRVMKVSSNGRSISLAKCDYIVAVDPRMRFLWFIPPSEIDADSATKSVRCGDKHCVEWGVQPTAQTHDSPEVG